MIPSLTPVKSFSTISSLGAVLAVNALKQGFEDVQRHKSDRIMNKRKVEKLCGREFIGIEWEKLMVGDIIKLKSEEQIPADCLVLSSSSGESVCYIETSNLDGESNHKIRKGLSLTKHLKDVVSLSSWRGVVKSAFPTVPIYEFTGQIGEHGDFERGYMSFNESNVLLRGSTLTNTDWVYGIVLSL